MKKLFVPPDSLRFGHLGNGMTVYTTAIEVKNDYLTIAHISPNRTVSIYKPVDEEIERKIREFAKNKNPSVSVTQPEQHVFYQ